MRQSTMLRITIVLISMLLGCATPSAVRDRPQLPVGNLLDLSAVESLGYEIYLRDQAAWQATDAALEAGLQKTPSIGWITLLRPTGWLVRFLGPCEDEVCSFLDVEKFDPDEPMLVTLHDGEILPEDQVARWRARQLAGESNFRRCTPQYNVAVVAAQEDGLPVWRVYLLASSKNPRDVVLTGHHRITTTYDGRAILKAEALSKSCVINQPPENVVGLMVTHILDPRPIETHVFTSLDYRMPLYVRTTEGQFVVNGASIEKND